MSKPGRNIVDDVLIATSISPRDLARQAEALRSWREAGFELHSLNDPSETSAIADAMAASDISVVSTPVTAYFGKPLLPVDAIIRHFRAQKRTRRFFGIINSDIALADPARLARALSQPAAVIFGRRGEVDRPDDPTSVPFGNGYDFFFLSPDVLPSVPESRFRIGAPWWDYWLPITQLLSGRRVMQVVPPVATHRRHGVAWHPLMFNEMGLHLFERLMSLHVAGQTNSVMDQKLYTRVLQNILRRVTDIEGERNAGLRREPAAWKRVLPALRAFHRILVEGDQRPDAPFAIYALADLSASLLEFIDEGSVAPDVAPPALPLATQGNN